MEEITTIAALRAQLTAARAAGHRIGLVPTMGSLHAGHLRLVEAARDACHCVVLSAFVNPMQFGPGEDFGRYPRDLDRDRMLAASHGVDLFFAPSVAEMLGATADLRIAAGMVGALWEGAVRPGHFDGMLTVVAKLFNIVAPDTACFGQKDIQQLTLVRRMIREFNFPIELIAVPTVREPDGLAMSSRNVYLSPDERVSALALSRALRAVDALWQGGELDPVMLRSAAEQVLRAAPGVATDYIAIVDPERLAPVSRAAPGVIVALAVRVGATRLIDNLILGEPAWHVAPSAEIEDPPGDDHRG